MNNNNRGNPNNRRRGRGNNRPQGGGGGQQLNRIDSRARGNAPQMLEKYRKLASDAHLNGDRVQAEYYLQFADHYFRVIADTRARQEEQRARAQGDRWQEPQDDEDDFSVESDFPTFDRAPQPRRDDQREGRDNRDRDGRDQRDGREFREPRENREPREPRENREPREFREPRRERNDRFRGDRDAPADAAAANPFETRAGDEGEPIGDEAANPFVPETRAPRAEPVAEQSGDRGVRGGLRPRREGRAPRAERAAPVDELPFDPASLPPAIGVRTEEPVTAEASEAPAAEAEAAPAPRKRGRPRKNPPAEAVG